MDFWISIGFLDFRVDFWISIGFVDFNWISGFQIGFLPTVYEISFVADPSILAANHHCGSEEQLL